ncbi:hypothetical protein, partial [Pseudomonas syringae]|uniref:hypothetical protein n=1 Tax=Pseudomonas syringae TaxID=317 RepID=UPI001BAED331
MTDRFAVGTGTPICDTMNLSINRHRGQPSGCTPATPPGMRVRTGRFERLRSVESRQTQPIKPRYRQHTMDQPGT